MPLVFIDLLKALAAVLITNSHLADVWPISAIASGGMLGNVLFFAVSGYCLTMPNRAGGVYTSCPGMASASGAFTCPFG